MIGIYVFARTSVFREVSWQLREPVHAVKVKYVFISR
jgi:hypothetical protein